MQHHILILGGTTEARLLGERLALRTDVAVTLSLAGRTLVPRAQAVPTRSGGFGGVAGLVHYLRRHAIAALIDATHPYAATMSAHASSAAVETGVPILALRRPPWSALAGDRWIEVDDMAAAVAALGDAPRRVLLTIGRQEVSQFAAAPRHHYLIRSVDPVEPPLAVPHALYVLERGPFDEESERELLLRHAIEVIVAKNSGGAATYGKIAAARSLGLPIVMLRRPPAAPVRTVTTIAAAVSWLDHGLHAPSERGV